ncbi:MAG: hypothetical protein LBJ67_18740 [Planctomycetaceae bacterium]|jgi:hypothetical protein|nr:hypothetical protein [Planctomycetaceae bacterium]
MTTSQKNILVLTILVVLNIVVLFSVHYWRKSHQVTLETHRPKSVGIGGPAIEAFDRSTDRWIEEMKAESIEESFALLNDLYEYRYSKITEYSGFDSMSFDTHEDRENKLYKYAVPQALSNRRFLKALEDLKKLSRSECVKLLTQCIQDNLKEKIRLYELDTVGTVMNKGLYRDNWALYLGESEGGNDFYRSRRKPGTDITQFACRYGILSCVLLAGQLELGKEMRPVIEEVIQQAKREYALYNSLGDDANSFKWVTISESLYNPSVLVTGTLCDRSWNAELKKELVNKGKLINRETVDYRARTTEYDWPAAEGWINPEPFNSKLPFRYYEKITDEEFNAAFP